MARRRSKKRRRSRSNPLSTGTTIVLGVVGVAAVGGIIYYLVSRSRLSAAADKALEGGVKGGIEGGMAAKDRQAAEDAAAAKATADAAAKAAIEAAAKAAADAAAAALQTAAVNAATAAFALLMPGNLGIGFKAAVPAAQAVGASRDKAIIAAWYATVAWLMANGRTRDTAERDASTTQNEAGFGLHTSSTSNTMYSMATQAMAFS